MFERHKLLFVAAAIAAVCISIAVSVVAVDRTVNADLPEIGRRVRSKILSKMQINVAIIKAVASFAEANTGKPVANISKPAKERMNNLTQFSSFAAKVSSRYKSLISVQSQPGAVVTQVYPEGATLGVDLLNTSQRSHILDAVAFDVLTVEGPRALVQGGFALVIQQPVYNYSIPYRNMSSWWGNVIIFVDHRYLIEETELVLDLAAVSGLQWVLVVASTNFVVASNLNATEVKSLLDSGTRVEIPFQLYSSASTTLQWILVLRQDIPRHSVPAQTIALIVIPAIVGSLLLVFLINFVWEFADASYATQRFAPTKAPFAYCIIGIHNAEEIWDIAPEAMSDICLSTQKCIYDAAAQHQSYQSNPLTQHCFVVLSDDIGNLANVILDALSAVEKLSLQRTLSCSVKCKAVLHWCGDPCLVQITKDGLYSTYKGEDISKAAKMYSRATPHSILMSEKAHLMLHDSATVLSAVKDMPTKKEATTRGGANLYRVSTKPESMKSESSFTAQHHGSEEQLSELLAPQAALLGLDVSDIEPIADVFYRTFKSLFRPLAKQERHNIETHLVTAFGIGRSRMVAQLAVRCVMKHVSKSHASDVTSTAASSTSSNVLDYSAASSTSS